MEELLTPLKTTATSNLAGSGTHLVEAKLLEETHSDLNRRLDSSEAALDFLSSKPGLEALLRVLDWLDPKTAAHGHFNIKLPGPKAAQIINVLVNVIVPDYWATLSGQQTSIHLKTKRLLLRCLSSVAGIGAITTRLRSLVTSYRDGGDSKKIGGVDDSEALRDVRDVLESILEKDTFITSIWTDISLSTTTVSARSLLWKELISILATGRLLSVAAEANEIFNTGSSKIQEGSWVGDGNKYSSWLGRNVGAMAIHFKEEDVEAWKEAARLLGKGLTLGYVDQVIEALYASLIVGVASATAKLRALIDRLHVHEQRTVLYSMIRIVSKRCLSADEPVNFSDTQASNKSTIGGLTGLLAALTQDSPALKDALVEWLTGISGGGIPHSNDTHRAVIAAIAPDHERTEAILQKSLQLFGDKLYIKHTPVLHQEVNVQILLMVAGYIHRSDPMYLIGIARSSIYLNAISNRLAASSQRARLLGMIVGATVSEVVDPPDKRLAFSSEEMNNTEGQWYRSLFKVQDHIGSVDDIKPHFLTTAPQHTNRKRTKPVDDKGGKQLSPISNNPTTTSKIISIEEVYDEVDSEDEDLLMYEKPDSESDDEDEDPTLVQRNKPTAPVYIRELISGLRDTENYDRHKLALATASSLIRRKANFGTEVSDHIEELATLLVGLGDKYEMEDFQQLRLQGMIAVLVAVPLRMGQWFSKTFFNGDYSMSQRASILTTLGMGARELAGFRKEDAALTGADAVPENPFPSKTLPGRLHKIYALEAAPVDALAKNLERTMIQPLAIEAADKVAGPNALKVRTFSSRMEVEKKRKKPIPNELAKIVAEGFFFPLTGRWRIQLQAYGNKSVQFSPFLLTSFIKTLALILHASGASTLSLPQMTSEFWDLLLSLRSNGDDSTVLEALLFAFLTVLDINEDKRRLAEDHAKELLETQQWAEQVFEMVEGGSEEGDRVRMLAASVLVRTREVVEKYQRLLMGDMLDYM
ncbi:Telomere length regulation protein, conserved domain [Lasallia pustulata]|uniref:Telomere length regulation protein, conserved domain n=1 Tax=Lasallia pustulata TaxID=136370 RepID=A0A1W5DAT4_9LECA|nr:Telomere length regulation protein, conserved domain [Lasallia pustulata]